MKRLMSTRKLAGSCALFLLVLGIVQLAASPTRLAIAVKPRYAIDPATAYVTVIVDRDADNRALLVETDGPAYYRSSYQQLDGASSPRVHQFALSGLPAGAYAISVTLTRFDGSHQ